jgi:hypothetical protein
MIQLIVGLICVLISFVIAAGAIGREARRLDSFSPVPVYDMEAAVQFVSDQLPEEISARVTFWDVRRVLDWSVSDNAQFGLSAESLKVRGPDLLVDELVIVDEGRHQRLLARAISEGTELSGLDIKVILQAELGYLRQIGAVGPEAGAGADVDAR